MRDVGVVSGACIVAPGTLLESLGLFDEGFRLYYEEDDLCHRVRAFVGRRVVSFPGVEVKHGLNKSISQMDPILRDRI